MLIQFIQEIQVDSAVIQSFWVEKQNRKKRLEFFSRVLYSFANALSTFFFYISPFCQCGPEIVSHQWVDSESIFKIPQDGEKEIACTGHCVTCKCLEHTRPCVYHVGTVFSLK